jgi:hypothetical protein
MAQYGTWVSYSGTARIALAGVLLIAAAGVALAGTRLRRPVRLPRPGRVAANTMLVAWVVSIIAFLTCVSALAHQARLKHLPQTRPPDPITPVTFTAVAVLFVIIVLLGRSQGWPVRLGSAAIGALAAPMIFEFPFDLIVMARIYPPIPGLHLALFFGPLFLVEFITLALLSLSSMVRLSRATFFGFASILVVFAVWGLAGFGYPSAPLAYSLNVLSKILAFVTALSLFLRRPDSSAQAVPVGEGAELVPLPGQVGGGRADHQAGDPFGG